MEENQVVDTPEITKKAKKPNKAGQAFSKFWTWFKDTAWIQVLLIIALIFGGIFAVLGIVDAVKASIERSKERTFYKDNQITYKEFDKKVENKESFLTFFYSPTCSHCEEVQEKVQNYFTSSKLNTTNTKFYSINVEDEVKITEENLHTLHDEFSSVYDTQIPEWQNEDYEYFKDADATGVPTPTLALYKDGVLKRVSLGVDSDVYDYFNRFLLIEE